MYARSKTFRAYIDSFAASKDMAFQFSKVPNTDKQTMATTNPAMRTTPEGGISAITMDGEGGLTVTIIPGNTELPVVLISIDLDKCLAQADALGVDQDEYLSLVISQEIGHANDALTLGFEGFWTENKKEESLPYQDRPAEQNADAISDVIMGELYD